MRLRRIVELWRARYRLTAGEANILFGVSWGATLDEVAVERGTVSSTVKKHSENLRLKTGDASLLIASHRLLREALALLRVP